MDAASAAFFPRSTHVEQDRLGIVQPLDLHTHMYSITCVPFGPSMLWDTSTAMTSLFIETNHVSTHVSISLNTVILERG